MISTFGKQPWLKKVASGIKAKKYASKGSPAAAVRHYIFSKYKRGGLHSGPGEKHVVKNRAQALAIMFHTMQRMGISQKKKGKKFSEPSMEQVHVDKAGCYGKKKKRRVLALLTGGRK